MAEAQEEGRPSAKEWQTASTSKYAKRKVRKGSTELKESRAEIGVQNVKQGSVNTKGNESDQPTGLTGKVEVKGPCKGEQENSEDEEMASEEDTGEGMAANQDPETATDKEILGVATKQVLTHEDLAEEKQIHEVLKLALVDGDEEERTDEQKGSQPETGNIPESSRSTEKLIERKNSKGPAGDQGQSSEKGEAEASPNLEKEREPGNLIGGKDEEETRMLEVQEHVRKAISELEAHLKAGEQKPGEHERESDTGSKQELAADKVEGEDARSRKKDTDGKGKEMVVASPFVPRRGYQKGKPGGMSEMFSQILNRVQPRSPPEMIKAIMSEEDSWCSEREWREGKENTMTSITKRLKHSQKCSGIDGGRKIAGIEKECNQPRFTQAGEF
jgi:hypothetical protein